MTAVTQCRNALHDMLGVLWRYSDNLVTFLVALSSLLEKALSVRLCFTIGSLVIESPTCRELVASEPDSIVHFVGLLVEYNKLDEGFQPAPQSATDAQPQERTPRKKQVRHTHFFPV